MLICPITGTRLKGARAKGGSFWYSPESRGRLLTLYMAKHFLGEDGARELWVRSESAPSNPAKPCPSCTRPMHTVKEPRWMGSFEVDICRICHMLWVDAEEHVEIPHPEDFINERGDSTRTKDWGDASATLTMENEKDESAFSEVPDSMAKIVLNFFGLPHEDHHRDVPTHVWITGFIIVACALLFAPFTLRHPEIIKEYGFYPGDPLKNHGLNILFGPLLHAGFVHLIYNLYFFGILADDVEERLGFFRYGAFVLFTFGFVAMSQIIWGTHPDVPHIGLSGLVMAVMTFYTLEFPKSRLVYMVPWIHSMHFQRGGYARIRGLRWLRIKIGWVALGYLAVDVLSYFLLERNGLTSVSHTAHISGAVIGAILWGALRPLRQMRPLKAANSQKDK